MTDKILDLIKGKYSLREIDAGEFKALKVNGMKFNISAFFAEGLGHVSVMRATGFFGLMKMDTVMVNPTEVDLPLYSYDRIFAMGNDTLITELYETRLTKGDLSALNEIKAEYGDIPERDAGVHWYDDIKLCESISKKSKKADTIRMSELAIRHFEAYLNADATPVLEKDIKLKKASEYVDGLLTRGGPSTDVFIKALGEEKTAYLYKNILFGTK